VWQPERDRRYKELSKSVAGVVAQDVEAVLPEAVAADERGYKSVNYYELIPFSSKPSKKKTKSARNKRRRWGVLRPL
jgi:hypothetical protein